MEPPQKRQKISRIEARNIYYQNQRRHQQPRSESSTKRARPVKEISNRSPSRSYKALRRMTHHTESLSTDERRQVDVEVDTSIVRADVNVDSEGNTIAINLPSVPAVPQFAPDFAPPPYPSVPPVTLPAVPSVPPYPFAAQPPAQATASPGNSTRPADVTASHGSTTSPTPTANPSTQPASTGTGISSTPSVQPSSSAESSATDISISVIETTTFTFESVSPSVSITDVGVPIGGTAGGSPAGAASSAAADGNGSASNSDDSPSTPTVVGGVVGGVAGLAVFLGLLLVLLRWYKRRQRGGALQLGDGDGEAADRALPATSEKGNLIPPAATALLSRYRFSAASKDTDVSTGTGERSFQRISGRKLPSVFSPGMTSSDVPPGSSYRDSQDTYIGSTAPAVAAASLSADKEKEMMMPSPARTPIIHENPFSDRFATGGPNRHVSGASTLSPPQSPHRHDTRFSRGTLGRSHPSFDGSRGSKFTEDV